jgi:GT2 family glycosyltransferase
MKPFAVAILNWNGSGLLQAYLPKVIAHSKALARIYVIDNASSDDSTLWVRNHYPEVKIIQHKENLGYAGGYNRAMPHITEAFVVLLNSDIETTPNWLAPIHQRFEENAALAACQPKIKDLKNPEYFEYAGAAGGFMDWLCYPFCRGRIFYELEKDTGQYNASSQVFWATGASLVVRKAHYLEAGGLDESLFAHMEEIDLCWRMQRHGFQVMYCAESTVFHLGGATLHETSPHKTYLNFRNNMIIMAKNLPGRSLFGKIAIRLVLDGIAALKFLFEGKGAHTWQVIRAHIDFYGRLPKLLKNRRYGPPKPRLKHLPGAFKGTTIWYYFARKQRTFRELPSRLFTGVK